MRILLAAIGCLCLFAAHLHAQVPELINYQGRVVVGSVNFSGTGQFKFALVNATGTTTFWSYSGTSTAGSEPNAGVSLTVASGLYSVLLGDTTLANMTAVPSTVFNNADVRLRIWFNNGTNGFQLLAPDQRLAAVGYAVIARNVQDGAITAAKIASGAVRSTQIAAGSVQSTNLATGAIGANQLANDSIQAGKGSNGSLLGEDFTANTITGTQISDVLELGSIAADGALRLWDAASDLKTILVEGGSSTLSILGTDGHLHAYLSGSSYGGLTLFDSSTTNNATAFLTTHEQTGVGPFFPIPGGALRLSNADQEEIYLKAGSGGGFLQFKRTDGVVGVQLNGEEATGKGGVIRVNDNTGNTVFQVSHDNAEGGGELRLRDASGTLTIFMEASEAGADGGQIAISNAAGTQTIKIDAEFGTGDPSRVTTGTVEITGGSDFAEQFDIRSTIGEPRPEPGMIVCIDPACPGKLRPSTEAYDRTVAGIISGAGGIRAGMLMGQRDSVADGAQPVALSGRAYCYVDTATGGPVVPGDLITSSATPGYGMKVTDHERARGTVIGKAMTGLEEGAGLVLVLVSLQ